MTRFVPTIACVLLAAAPALAQDPADPAAPVEASPPSAPPAAAEGQPTQQGVLKPPRLIVSAGIALPFYIYARPAGGATAMHFTPDERTSLAQSLAVGYVVNPKVSVLINALFLETLRTDQEMGKTGFAFGGIAAMVSYRFYKTMTFSAGPMYFYREYFLYENDIGAFYALAYGIPMPNKFVLSLALNSPQAYFNKPVVAVAAGVNIARRF